MKGVGSMRRLLSFIFAILIAVFAVMPNVYAEAQKDYGNLDMNRWVYVASDTQNVDLLVDVTSFDYSSSTVNKLVCNLWVCYFRQDTSRNLQNLTVNYFDKSFTIDSMVSYDKDGNIEYNYTNPLPERNKIVPGSMVEIIYYVAFPPELMEKLKEEAMKNK